MDTSKNVWGFRRIKKCGGISNNTRKNGIDIYFGDPAEEVPGKSIVLPAHPSLISVTDIDLDRVRRSHIKNAVGDKKDSLTEQDIEYLCAETNSDRAKVMSILATL